jgi:hypothetical protein
VTYQQSYRVCAAWEGDEGLINVDASALRRAAVGEALDVDLVVEQDPSDQSNWYLRVTWRRVPAEDPAQAVIEALRQLRQIVGNAKRAIPAKIKVDTTMLGPGE